MKAFNTGFTRRGSFFGFGRYFAFVLAVAIAAGALSCASGRSAMREPTGVTIPETYAAPDLSEIKSLAVMDFYRGRIPTMPGTAYVCHITGLHFIRGDIASGSGELIADQFRFNFSERGLEVVSGGSTREAFDGIDPEIISAYDVNLGIAVGNRLKVGAVVMGSVMRFEELIGTKFAADKPASVSFSVALIDMREKRIVWKAKFEKTQKPLLSNVLDYKTFFKGGMAWQKARRLSAIGVENTLQHIHVGGLRP